MGLLIAESTMHLKTMQQFLNFSLGVNCDVQIESYHSRKEVLPPNFLFLTNNDFSPTFD